MYIQTLKTEHDQFISFVITLSLSLSLFSSRSNQTQSFVSNFSANRMWHTIFFLFFGMFHIGHRKGKEEGEWKKQWINVIAKSFLIFRVWLAFFFSSKIFDIHKTRVKLMCSSVVNETEEILGAKMHKIKSGEKLRWSNIGNHVICWKTEPIWLLFWHNNKIESFSLSIGCVE